MKRLVHFIFIVFLYWHTLALATISVQTKPAAIWQGEEFHLIIRLEHNKLDTLPDLSPLRKDFVVIGTETSMVYSIINSKSNIMNQIDLTLIAKKTGDLVIPSLNIGNEYSMPLKINVKESQSLAIPTPPGSTDASNDPIFLESKSDINQAFINQQIIYTVRLYSNQRILNGEYVPPKAEDAIVVPLGSGKSYQTTLNERIYAVEEQRYAIFPQKAGELKIIPPQFNAIILSAVAQQIHAVAKPSVLIIKPVPAPNNRQNWLPASQLAITEVYENNNKKIKQGSTLVRTITIQAAGMVAQLLPTLNIIGNDGFKVYIEKPILENTSNAQDLIAKSVLKITYLFSKAQKLSLPKLELSWFNTHSSQAQTASLPAHSLEITPNTFVTDKIKAINHPLKQHSHKSITPKLGLQPQTKNDINLAWWLVCALILLWLLTLLAWWCFHKSNKNSATNTTLIDTTKTEIIKNAKKVPYKPNTQRLALKFLRKICKNNNPTAIEHAILSWAALKWPEIKLLNLTQLAVHIKDHELQQQLILLSQTLYGENKNNLFKGEDLWRSLSNYLSIKVCKKSKNCDLPPINPN